MPGSIRHRFSWDTSAAASFIATNALLAKRDWRGSLLDYANVRKGVCILALWVRESMRVTNAVAERQIESTKAVPPRCANPCGHSARAASYAPKISLIFPANSKSRVLMPFTLCVFKSMITLFHTLNHSG